MKKFLALFMSFFVILPISTVSVSCSLLEEKNNTDDLIKWFNNNYPDYRVKTVSLDIKDSSIYLIDGYTIDKVMYTNSNFPTLKNNDNEMKTDYVIYNIFEHRFYDQNNLIDNVYAFVSWCYVGEGSIDNSFLNTVRIKHPIYFAFVKPVSDDVYTDYVLTVSYKDGKNPKLKTITFYGKWVQDQSIPTFVLTSSSDSTKV